jgi:hypothetical protein
MKITTISATLLSLVVLSAQAQKKSPYDTVTTNYQPSAIFSTLPYTQNGNEVHSPNGEPGPKYWQNRVDYQLDVKLDTVAKTISGSANISYTNNSPDALQYLWLHLDQNTYRKEARSNFVVTAFAAPGHTEGYIIESVSMLQNGKLTKLNYVVTDTRMQVRLPQAVTPKGGKINFVVKYHYTIPGNFGERTDYVDTKNGKIYEIAQFYPRMCVYDMRGWDTAPFLGSGEFYLEYGDIDYKVTLPADMIVAGSGELVNPSRSVDSQTDKPFSCRRNSDKTMMIRTAARGYRPGIAPGVKGNLTWHFKMLNTRDVAFGASKLLYGMPQG